MYYSRRFFVCLFVMSISHAVAFHCEDQIVKWLLIACITEVSLGYWQAASLRIAEQYIQAFSNIAKEVKSSELVMIIWRSPFIIGSWSLSWISTSGYHNVAS